MKNLLVTGRPGIGKTTVVLNLLQELQGLAVAGFTTREIRGEKKRKGFELASLSGERMVLAHVDVESSHRVGKYGVDVEGFETMLRSLELPDSQAEVVLIDEIGKMECLSAMFIDTVKQLLDSPGIVVATVAARGSGFIEEVKKRTDCELIVVTSGNRNDLPHELARLIRSVLSGRKQ